MWEKCRPRWLAVLIASAPCPAPAFPALPLPSWSPFASYAHSSLCNTVAKSRGLILQQTRPDQTRPSRAADETRPGQNRPGRGPAVASAFWSASSAEIYSGNKILFAPLVDGTINSSGIRSEHVLRLASLCFLCPPNYLQVFCLFALNKMNNISRSFA